MKDGNSTVFVLIAAAAIAAIGYFAVRRDNRVEDSNIEAVNESTESSQETENTLLINPDKDITDSVLISESK